MKNPRINYMLVKVFKFRLSGLCLVLLAWFFFGVVTVVAWSWLAWPLLCAAGLLRRPQASHLLWASFGDFWAQQLGHTGSGAPCHGVFPDQKNLCPLH